MKVHCITDLQDEYLREIEKSENDVDILSLKYQFPNELEKIITSILPSVDLADDKELVVMMHSNLENLCSYLHPCNTESKTKTAKLRMLIWGITDERIPTIHLSYENLKDGLKSCRCSRFLDSSIWHYFLQVSKYDPESSIESLKIIFEQILSNYQKGYYDLTISWEYKELQERLLAQSYIHKYDDGQIEHASLSPFLFHSERENKERLNNCKELLNFNWRILLVDDCADNIQYTYIDGNNKEKSIQGRSLSMQREKCNKKIYKEAIIRDRLQWFFTQLQLTEARKAETPITLDCAICVDQAKDKMRINKYDLILLDYKLAENKYGYDLLSEISKSNQLQKLAAPNGKFYFMFISAYTTAVQERLRCEDFSVDTDYWFIGRGACPTNTPYLFLYCLKRMMEVRYNKLTEHSKQLLKDLNEDDLEASKEIYISMTMFLTKLYEKDKERNNCVKGFNAFLNLRRVYDIIKDDVDINNEEKSSRLILSMFKDEKYGSNSFWEHLQNLVYLTAFGTIRQWPEMWEDYIFIKGKLEKAESEYESYWAEDKYTKPSILIRDYILSLKGMMS